MVDYVSDMLKFLELYKNKMTIGLVKQLTGYVAKVTTERILVDQIESSKYELSEGNLLSASNFLITSLKLVKAPRNIIHILKDPNFYL